MMKTTSPAATTENFAALFEESLARKEMRVGEVITAEVIRVDDNYVVVNAGLKSEEHEELVRQLSSMAPRGDGA